ncbi:type II toxin-antitoxin system RelE/ParE family toxin [Agrobacterium salinitolerans]|uniref:type II toxin-antitoxin system RelE/ParE family toxin n=1 Tax=Agrobacterium salinitolerans TaxID=1183413 RepID=UPI00098FD461|nr:type II toxin-antitoxin system RelE/ParE family toxin [Agrobacterium salinitolerans]OOO23788.1 plasmid stabilization protein [Agrobacterium salinitolerans]PNQ23567.1 type II toxin-antitoxin system RelE/ParE family toxin [Rhizobium sp. YIC5082]
MIVVLTDEAKADLDRIGDFIAADNPRRAETFVVELLDRCSRLVEMPRAYPLVARYEQTGVRRRPYMKTTLFFYRVTGTRVEILHILNGAQDHEPILFPQD